MKKLQLLIAAAGLVFMSCNKEECAECHYDKNGGEVELGERCGDDIEEIEANGYEENGVTYTVHCGDGH